MDFYVFTIQNSSKNDINSLVDNIKLAMYSTGIYSDDIDTILKNNGINGKYMASFYYNNITFKPVKEFATEIKAIIESIKS